MATPPTAPSYRWWKEATGYQIYPASFKDSNGDGWGDINGITSSLDYLVALGVDFIWISPVYESPDHDMGYDISDYEAISRKYGSMADMDRLLAEAKRRGLRVLMDLVVNHTSRDHAWFRASRRSRDNKHSDWYIWRDPKYDAATGKRKPPNNWQAVFGGSAWTYVPERDQYYFHLCFPEQPDLNWENAEARRAIYGSAIEFWLKKGIDGFRVDLVNAYAKNQSFPDAPITDPSQEEQLPRLEWLFNGAGMHAWLREQRTAVLDKYGEDVVLIGELPVTPRDEVLRYVAPASRELDMTLDFGLFTVGNTHWTPKLHEMRRHTLPELKRAIAATQGLVVDAAQGWTTTFLENHDNARSVDHFGPGGGGQYGAAAAKLLALFVTTLSGTLIVYQGQEIGMTNVPKDTWRREDLRDQVALRYLRAIDEQHPGDEALKREAFDGILRRGRDNTRTPMQWTGEEPHAGFSAGDAEPWMRVNPNYKTINVADQERDEQSVLSFWKTAVASRKAGPSIFIYGEYQVVDEENEQTYTYWKKSATGTGVALVVLNFSSERAEMPSLMDEEKSSLECLMSTVDIKQSDALNTPLEPWEGRVFLRR
ncbi:glycoside hydrolase family 13 protein [Xylariaceae sp. FL1651]|nr:glycoside hydrolase family 13 protein [Xylariaceae sp. FL1651]